MIKNILSLFDGMSCGQIALQDIGIEIGQYYAAEIDKHAVKMSQYLFPNMIHLGDVTKWEEWNIDWSSIDILMGGSPCQGFSFAGKQLAFDDPRSKLFFVFVDILNHIKKHNPNVKFLLENVRMAKEHENVITRYMGVEPIFINSALVSAQNRQRLYWTNIFNQPSGLFSEPKCMIPQPKDRGILLKDILEVEVPEKYFLSDKMLNALLKHQVFNKFSYESIDSENKSSCITSHVSKMGNAETYIKIDKKGNIKNNQDKASCFTAGANSGGNHSDMDLINIQNKIRRLTPRECLRL
jgi:DNA-cytosine methyltransferase